MKNFCRILGIIAIVAVIGFSMAACGDDDGGTGGGGGSGGGGSGGGGGNGSGTLTITNIPSKYNGMYLYMGDLSIALYSICGCDPREKSLPQIKNGTGSIPLWKVGRDGNVTRYSGDDQIFSGPNMTITTASTEDEYYTTHNTAKAYFYVDRYFKFSNGSYTISWNNCKVTSEN